MKAIQTRNPYSNPQETTTNKLNFFGIRIHDFAIKNKKKFNSMLIGYQHNNKGALRFHVKVIQLKYIYLWAIQLIHLSFD